MSIQLQKLLVLGQRMASTERTPLTSQRAAGPAYVFPGVAPRSRRRHLRQFQCCMCFVFSLVSLIILLAIILAVIYTATERKFLPNDDTTAPILPFVPLNDSEIKLLLLSAEDPLDDEPNSEWKLPNPYLTLLAESEQYGRKSLGDRELMEENVDFLPINTPSFRSQRAMSTSAEARKYARRGYVELSATKFLADKLNYTKPKKRITIGEGPAVSLADMKPIVDCRMFSQYRTSNGSCNNAVHQLTWGVGMQPFRRILQPDYEDGISAPRNSHWNASLPTARQVSLGVHRPSFNTDPNFTVMLAVWGQFLDHDITATALTQTADGAPIDCCAEKEHLHPDCFPVPLGPGDPFFEDNNLECMSFLRSAAASTGKLGPREQFNQVSSFIDGSMVYGSTDAKQNSLRSGEGGALRMFITPDNRTLLPISTDPTDGCNEAEMNAEGKYCFDAGDSRANENLHLTSLHLLLARHHNYLADNLASVNPNWTDEKIFQEARKILGAQLQHIHYNEFIPVLFGEDFARTKGLLPRSAGSGDTYRENVDASVANGFAAAAFRFAHTLLPGLMRATQNNSTEDSINLHKMLFNPYTLWNHNGVDDALNSAVDTPMARSDQYFSSELTQKLFQGHSSSKQKPSYCCEPGLDLVSLNIQRGRDHGLPAYYEWRKHCRLPDTDTWEKMAFAVNKLSLLNLKALFSDAREVDFYSGALSEPPMEGGILGPLLTCIISDQFWRIKHGDSHWYERPKGPQRFTKDQLNQIYKTSLAGLICINSDEIVKVPRYVMQKTDVVSNPVVNCSEVDEFDFSPWNRTRTVTRVSTAHISTKVRVVQKDITLKQNTTRKVLV